MQLPVGEAIQPVLDVLGHYPERPKEEVGRYFMNVAGLRVPEIFESRKAAEASREPYFARSEGPGELAGYSGLTQSIHVRSDQSRELVGAMDDLLHDDDRSYDALADPNALAGLGYSRKTNEEWSRFVSGGYRYAETWRQAMARDEGFIDTSDSANEFARLHGLSYWQAHYGVNFFIVEDSGRKERYFIGQSPLNRNAGYEDLGRDRFTVVEKGAIVHDSVRGEPFEFDVYKAIEMYKKVRQNPIVAKGYIPIVEGVDDGGEETLFLQILLTHKQQEVEHCIDMRPKLPNRWIRGATGPEGVELRMYSNNAHLQPHDKPFGFIDPKLLEWGLPEHENLLQRATLEISGIGIDRPNIVRSLGHETISHGMRSTVFKPQVFTTLPVPIADRIKQSDTVHLVSDGNHLKIEYFDVESGNVASVRW